MHTFMHPFPEDIEYRKRQQRKAVAAANTVTRMSAIGKQIFRALLLTLLVSGCLAVCVNAQSRKQLVTGQTYKGHTADYAHVQKKKAYRTRQPSKAIAFWRDLKREVRHALNDVFMADAHSTPVPYNSIARVP